MYLVIAHHPYVSGAINFGPFRKLDRARVLMDELRVSGYSDIRTEPLRSPGELEAVTLEIRNMADKALDGPQSA